jgi:hypothetical protein
MEYKNILLTFEGEIGILAINRPKALNALNIETLKDIQMGIQEAKDHSELKILIVTGSGEKAFVAGADIAEMKGMNAIEALNFSKLGHLTLKMIQDFDRPVIAAVNGYALGGGTEIAVACDFIYASENARFGLPGHPRHLSMLWRDAETSSSDRERKGEGIDPNRKNDYRSRGVSDGDCQSSLSPDLPDGGDKKSGPPDRSQWSRWSEIGQDGCGCWF